ncbi:MAG: two-component system, sensor histidine kinase PdtaS [Acidimicrobiaceae bacterium]|jgi:two-component sensor histidine kinase|nr:two-component system, sensor histidine kinase PdtaS [Acidimicrobiaceae bacterium]
MATMAELARDYTELDGPTLSHLQRLVASWGMLSDLCFADLLLFVPVSSSADRFIVLGQVRPTTSQTLHRDDLVGHVIDEVERPLVSRCWRLASIVEGEVGIPSRNERGRLVSIPVRWQDKVVAVMTRESALSVGRRPGELERVYVEVFDRFARMIVAGEYPYPIEEPVTSELRVGDGVLLLDSTGRVEYASPNAVNALHRMGMYSGLEGMRLDEVGIDETAVDEAFETALSVTEEVEGRPDVTVVIRCMPLLENRKATGALVLMRDVSDLRRFHRLLLSKDAAIREVHHRVKNNLQTISSLLRLQARRLPPGEGKSALEESERRVRTIALVHEILSRDASDQVDFNDIVPSLLRMAEDLLAPEAHFRIGHDGEAGELPATVATPLAVILTELLQNAAEHAFPEGPGVAAGQVPPGHEPLRVHVSLKRDDGQLLVQVRDNGQGLPEGFSIEESTSLGLSIVRDLVRTQLGGTIEMRTDGGTVVDVIVPTTVQSDDDEGLPAPP